MQAQKDSHAVETQWKVLQSVNEWSRSMDTKAGAVLTADGILVGLAGTALKDNLPYLRTHPLALVLVGLALFCLLASAWWAGRCLSPTLGFEQKAGIPAHPTETADVPSSMLYFEHIAAQPEADYVARAVAHFADPANMLHDLAQQIHANATVCSTKAKRIGWAVFWLMAAMGLSVVVLLLGLWRG